MKAYVRNYPRLDAIFPITCVVDGRSTVHRGRTRDIGGGGLSFETPDELSDRNVPLDIAFEIRGVSVKARGEIVSSSYDAANSVHLYRLAFTKIPHNAHTLVTAYVLRNRLAAIVSRALGNAA